MALAGSCRFAQSQPVNQGGFPPACPVHRLQSKRTPLTRNRDEPPRNFQPRKPRGNPRSHKSSGSGLTFSERHRKLKLEMAMTFACGFCLSQLCTCRRLLTDSCARGLNVLRFVRRPPPCGLACANHDSLPCPLRKDGWREGGKGRKSVPALWARSVLHVVCTWKGGAMPLFPPHLCSVQLAMI